MECSRVEHGSFINTKSAFHPIATETRYPLMSAMGQLLPFAHGSIHGVMARSPHLRFVARFRAITELPNRSKIPCSQVSFPVCLWQIPVSLHRETLGKVRFNGLNVLYRLVAKVGLVEFPCIFPC
jgi:hypothetical protein